MFKFFRQYNKYLLTVFVAVLMVVFLIDIGGNLSRSLSPSREKAAIGHINGQKVTYGDQDAALSELSVLQRISPLLSRESRREAALGWLLALRDARNMGLSYSQSEVNQVLQMFGLGEQGLADFARNLKVSTALIRQTVAHWIMVQQYEDLAAGLAPMPPVQRLSLFIEAIKYQNEAGQLARIMRTDPSKVDFANQMRYYQYLQTMQQLVDSAQGQPRLSEAEVEHYVYDQRASAKISALAISCTRYLDKVAPPSAQTVQELFAKYKDNLPGESQPYGIGYRFPDRVKIEYLEIPFERLQAAAKVEEVEALAYYEQHGDEFRAPAPPPSTQPAVAPPVPKVLPYIDVRDRVIAHLRLDRAAQLGDRMLKEAQGILLDDARKLAEQGGYRIVPAGWSPKPFAEVARLLQSRFGVLPDVIRKDADWLDRKSLENLSGIGASRLGGGNQRAGQNTQEFVNYVMSSKELKPKDDNPLVALRLQVGLPSTPTIDNDGSRYLFRLIDAQPARSPAALDEVRAQVTYNARQLAAYQRLLQDKTNWLKRLRNEKLAALAAELKETPITPDFFHRRELESRTLKVPFIQGVGADRKFVDAVFDLVDRVAQVGDLSAATPGQRTAAIPVDSRLSLYLVTLDDYRTMTRKEYDQFVANYPQTPVWFYQALVSNSHQHQTDLLDALKARVGYVDEHPEKQGKDEGAE